MNKGIYYHIAYSPGGSIDTDSLLKGMTIYKILKTQLKLDRNNQDCLVLTKGW